MEVFAGQMAAPAAVGRSLRATYSPFLSEEGIVMAVQTGVSTRMSASMSTPEIKRRIEWMFGDRPLQDSPGRIGLNSPARGEADK